MSGKETKDSKGRKKERKKGRKEGKKERNRQQKEEACRGRSGNGRRRRRADVRTQKSPEAFPLQGFS